MAPTLTRLQSHGPTLHDALQLPVATLRFYPFGITLEHTDRASGEQYSYAIHPDSLSTVFGAATGYTSGLLAPDIIYTAMHGTRQTLVGYRPPQLTGIFLDGLAAPLRVPLPGLLMVRRDSTTRSHPDYTVVAVKAAPLNLNVPLFNAPLPNVYNSTGVCWGSVQQPNLPADPHQATSLEADWRSLLGSAFGNHSCNKKSLQEPDDIRRLLTRLDDQKALDYPLDDLVPHDDARTLRVLLENMK